MSIPPPGAVVTSLRSLLDGANACLKAKSVELHEPVTPYTPDDFSHDGIGFYEEIVPLLVTLANVADEIATLDEKCDVFFTEFHRATTAGESVNGSMLIDVANAWLAYRKAVDAQIAKFPPRASVAT